MSGSKGFANAKDSSGKTKLMILSYLQFLFPNECGGAFLLARFCEVWEISPVSGDLGRYDLTHGKCGILIRGWKMGSLCTIDFSEISFTL